MQAHARARGHPKTPLAKPDPAPASAKPSPDRLSFNCILEQGYADAPPPPHSRKAGEARGTGKASAKRQDQRPAEADSAGAGAGSPGIRLGRPCGAGFALRPGLIGRKDHGRRRAQAARQGRAAVMGALPPQQDPSASAVLAVLPMLAASGCAWVRATPGGVLPRLPRPQSAGACPCEDAGHLHRASPSLLRERP